MADSPELAANDHRAHFEVRDKQVVIDYHPVNLGIALGVDGRLYVLSTPGFTTTESRLDVLDPSTGRLLRTARLSTAQPTIAVGRDGRAYLLDASQLLSVGVNEEEDIAAARAFIGEFGFTFPVVLGRGSMRRQFHYPGLPCTVLIDRAGRIAGRWIGFADPAQLQTMRALIRSELDRDAHQSREHRQGA